VQARMRAGDALKSGIRDARLALVTRPGNPDAAPNDAAGNADEAPRVASDHPRRQMTQARIERVIGPERDEDDPPGNVAREDAIDPESRSESDDRLIVPNVNAMLDRRAHLPSQRITLDDDRR
jgi:hypothetical protein